MNACGSAMDSVGFWPNSPNGVEKLWTAPEGEGFARRSFKIDNFKLGRGPRLRAPNPG